MIDFTNCQKNKYKYYGGKNGGKICIIYNNQDYMLKFPSINNGISEHEYSNSCISEYIACHIINSIGLNVQETILGKYKVEEEEKIVVACKDFTSGGNILKQFAELKNSQIETSKNGYGTELAEVIETIENQPICDPEELKKFFWDMFIVDSFVGNFDRHNGNWGFLINETLQKIEIAPIYDCGSCLFSTLTDEKMEEILNKEGLLRDCIKNTSSAIKYNGSKIKYYDFITKMENKDCIEALNRIYPNIEIEKINNIIDKIPCISDIRKSFYKKIIKSKYNDILKVAYKKRKE
mgnify:CR=1 FL=1